MADPDYRVVVEVGAHSYDVTFGDVPDYGITLPLTVGWEVPENVDYFPAQANPLSGSFGIVAPTIGDVADIGIGDDVLIEVYTPSTAVDPWQKFVGVVTQVQAEPGARNRLTVWFTDNTWRLTEKVVGLADWPLEIAGDRLQRICDEAGIALAFVGITGEGLLGILAARSASPTDALSAIRQTMKDDATRNASYDPTFPIYGRNVYTFDALNNSLVVLNWERRIFSWPGELGADGTIHRRPGEPNAIDGCAALASGRWSRLPIDRPTYVLVDQLREGDNTVPGAVPLIHNTSYVDDFTLPAGNTTATARVFLARSLVPTDADGAPTWRTDSVRHLSYLDPEPVAGWIGADSGGVTINDQPSLAWARLRPTIVEPIDPSLTLDGRTWIAGTLAAARLTIPPGGRFYIDFTLRPDLFETQPFLNSGSTTYADIPPALTYADLDPLLTYRDLRTIGV